MDAEAADSRELSRRLVEMSTVWTTLLRAHGGPVLAEAEAQQRFMERYHGAVSRYLLTALKDRDAANELFQEFSLRFIRGDFRNVDPTRGRFRDYLRTALLNLIRDWRKRQADRREIAASDGLETVEANVGPSASEVQFEQHWREELIALAMSALDQEQQRGGQPFYTVLRFGLDHPKMNSRETAQHLNDELKPQRPFTDTSVRKTLQRAREKFADLMIDEVARSLGEPPVAELEQELIELKLLAIPYCRSALDRRWILQGDADDELF